MHNIRRRALSGLGWSGATQILDQVLRFIVSVILARLLGPRDFGLIGMVLVFTGFASRISELGLGASLVQRREVSDRHLNAVFWVNVATGAALTLLFALLAPLIARFYREPLLRLLTVALAANFLLGSVTIAQDSLLSKSLDFRTRFRIAILSLTVSGLVALLLAYFGAGVWSLVGQSITGTTMRVVVMWRLSSWRPRRAFDVSAFRELMRFGRHMVAFDIVNYWGSNFDKLIVGRALGSSALGIYNLAGRLMQLPVTNVTGITGTVMFPALSAMQDEGESVRRAYLRATRMIALCAFPMMIGLGVVAEPAILVLYGEKWSETISVLRILCVAGLANSVYFTAGWIFLSRGRSDLHVRWGIYAALVRVIGILVGVQWGILGVAWAHVAGTWICICYPTWSSAVRLVNLRFRDMLHSLRGPFCCAVAMGVLLWMSDRWMLGDMSMALRLVVHVFSGIIIYGFLIRHFRLEAWEDVRRVVIEMGGGKSRLITWLVNEKPRAKP